MNKVVKGRERKKGEYFTVKMVFEYASGVV